MSGFLFGVFMALLIIWVLIPSESPIDSLDLEMSDEEAGMDLRMKDAYLWEDFKDG